MPKWIFQKTSTDQQGVRVDKVFQKLTKSYESELRHLFQCCNLTLKICPRKTPFQHTVGGGGSQIPMLQDIRW